MKAKSSYFLAASVLALASAHTSAQVPATDKLRPAADERAKATVYARGSQIYRCEADPADASRGRWVFQAPEADLFNDPALTQYMGRHYDGPTWEGQDLSKVEGRVKVNVPAPQSNAIPWLLLDGISAVNAGVFSNVSSIQRLETVGGRLTEPACLKAQWGATLRLPYTATYVFFTK